MSARRGEPGRVRLTFEDAGSGVAAADLELIFDKFQRGHLPGQGARRGMGVGLSIVRGMAEALGGIAHRRAGRSSVDSPIDLDLLAAPELPETRIR